MKKNGKLHFSNPESVLLLTLFQKNHYLLVWWPKLGVRRKTKFKESNKQHHVKKWKKEKEINKREDPTNKLKGIAKYHLCKWHGYRVNYIVSSLTAVDHGKYFG